VEEGRGINYFLKKKGRSFTDKAELRLRSDSQKERGKRGLLLFSRERGKKKKSISERRGAGRCDSDNTAVFVRASDKKRGEKKKQKKKKEKEKFDLGSGGRSSSCAPFIGIPSIEKKGGGRRNSYFSVGWGRGEKKRRKTQKLPAI